jgi:hypothetical protein
LLEGECDARLFSKDITFNKTGGNI